MFKSLSVYLIPTAMDCFSLRTILNCPKCSLLGFHLEENTLHIQISLCTSHIVGLVIGNGFLPPDDSSPVPAEAPQPVPATIVPSAAEAPQPAPATAEAAQPVPTTDVPATAVPATAVPATAVLAAAVPAAAIPVAGEPAPVADPSCATTSAVRRKRKDSNTEPNKRFRRKRRTKTEDEYERLMTVYSSLLTKTKEGPVQRETLLREMEYGYNAFYAYRPIVELSIADPQQYSAALSLKGEEPLKNFASYCKDILKSLPQLKELRKT